MFSSTNQRGMTAIEMVGAVALAGVVAIGSASLIKNVMVGKKESDARANTMVIEKMFEQHMYSRKGCEILVGKKIGDPFEVSVANMVIKEGASIVESAPTIPGGTQVTEKIESTSKDADEVVAPIPNTVANTADMRFKETKIESLNIVGFVAADSTNTRGVTMLTLKMESNGREVTKEVPMVVNVAPDGGGLKIESCLMGEKALETAIMTRVCPDTYGTVTNGLDCTQVSDVVRREVIRKICTDLDQGTLTSMGIEQCLMNQLHANQDCASGELATGFDWQGNLICDGAPTPPPPSTCSSWTAWSPAANTVCKDQSFVQNRNCNDGVVTDSQSIAGIGTKTTDECEEVLKCNVSYYGYNDNKWGTTASDGAWNSWGYGDDNDKECNNRGCAIAMGLACTGPTRVRLKYQFRMNVNSSEITTVWSNPSGSLIWGGPAVVVTDKVDECDGGPGCGLRVVAETEDSAYQCSISYQYRNEKVSTTTRSDGVWSVVVNDADDDNCEKNTACGIRSTIICGKAGELPTTTTPSTGTTSGPSWGGGSLDDGQFMDIN